MPIWDLKLLTTATQRLSKFLNRVPQCIVLVTNVQSGCRKPTKEHNVRLVKMWGQHHPQTECERQKTSPRVMRELQERITRKDCSSQKRNALTVNKNRRKQLGKSPDLTLLLPFCLPPLLPHCTNSPRSQAVANPVRSSVIERTEK